MLVINYTRREKLDMTRLRGRTVHAASGAAGVSDYGAGPAAYMWYLSDGRNDRILLLFDVDDDFTPAIDASGAVDGGTGTCLSDAETARLRTEAGGFLDVTEVVFGRLVAAERLASVADFAGMPTDMGVPVGYFARLREIWNARGEPS